MYRLTKPLVGVPQGDQHAVTFPEGSLVEKADLIDRVGIVVIQCAGESVRVFVTDLLDRIEPLGEIE